MSKFGGRRRHDERGAAAVEFALILALVLVPLLLGMMEFGRAYTTQISLTGAAREGARSMAIANNAGTARTVTRDAAPALNPALTNAQIGICVSATPGGNCAPGTTQVCVPNQTVTVQATYTQPFFTNFFGTNIVLRGRGVMRCGG